MINKYQRGTAAIEAKAVEYLAVRKEDDKDIVCPGNPRFETLRSSNLNTRRKP